VGDPTLARGVRIRRRRVGAERAWGEVSEAEEELVVAAGGVFGAFDEFEGGHAAPVDGDVAAGVGEVFERVGHGVDDAR
jgi:hypothetical protein